MSKLTPLLVICFFFYSFCLNAQTSFQENSNEKIFLETTQYIEDKDCGLTKDVLIVHSQERLNFIEILNYKGDIVMRSRKREINISKLRKGKYFLSSRLNDQFVVKQFEKI